MKHGLMGCSSIVKAVLLQGMLAEKGVFGRIVPSMHGYAVKITHTEDHPRNTVTSPPTLEFADEGFQALQAVPTQGLLGR